MTRLRLIAVLAVVVLVVAACGSHSGSQPSTVPRETTAAANTQPPEARPVPSQLRFIAKTLAGQDFHGQSLLGEPAVVWFWAPWDPICRDEAAMVGEVATAHPDVTFVGVGGLAEVPAMKEFVDKSQVKDFTELADTGGTVWAKFGVTQQPAFAFISSDGSMDVVQSGLSEPDLNLRVKALSEH